MRKESKIEGYRSSVKKLKKEYATDYDKFREKLAKITDKEVQALVFDKHLIVTNNAKNGNNAITNFFKTSKK